MCSNGSYPARQPASDRSCSVRRSAGRLITIRIAFVFLVLLTSLVAYSTVARADSPPNITADIPWTDTGGVFDPDMGTYDAMFGGVIDIEAAYNNARRQEEIQLGLFSGVLGNLNLPAQATWDTYSDDQKATVILNAERVARNGMTPGVLGLPFTASQVNVNNVAQGHANYLLSANKTGHIDGAGNSPFDRIDSDPVLGPCHEFLNRAENISYYWTSGSSNPLYIERSIYGWVYDDSSSSWGHREAVLLQDKDLTTQNSTYGFNNNVGSTLNEGYIGIGVAESATYDPYGWGWVNWGTIVVFNVIDPISTGSCPWDTVAPVCYSLTLAHEGNGSNPVAIPANSAGCDIGKYTVGERISLSTTPEFGWAVAHWSGTNDDSSTLTSNSLTMPASDHAVGIRYVPTSDQVFEYIYLPLVK